MSMWPSIICVFGLLVVCIVYSSSTYEYYYCLDYRECSDKTVKLSDSAMADGDYLSVGCYSAKSCYQSIVNNVTAMSCMGDSSCAQSSIKLINNKVDSLEFGSYYSALVCSGYAACYNSTLLQLYDYIECDGTLSCSNLLNNPETV